MKPLTFALRSWSAAAPGAMTGQDGPGPFASRFRPACRLRPLAARRLSAGARLAVECALAAAGGSAPGFAVFASRSAELPRCEKILSCLAGDEDPSPTDFMMSVHNAAAGFFSIEAHCRVPHSSVAAGEETFSAALFEAAAALGTGAGSVLAVFYENDPPPVLGRCFLTSPPPGPWAVALMLSPGGELCAEPSAAAWAAAAQEPALQLLSGLASGVQGFEVREPRRLWRWSRI